MLFSSLLFVLLFLPWTIVFYYFSPKKFKNVLLLVSSIIFYAWGEPVFVLVMLYNIGISYWFGRQISKSRSRNSRIFTLGIVFLLSPLILFKYTNFIIEIIESLGISISYVSKYSLPIGISFYTFQSISYLTDVWRKKVNAQKNLISLGLYISFFPQLIAGPIVTYNFIEKQLENRKESFEKFSYGITRFVRGLATKILLANFIGKIADFVFNSPIQNLTFMLSLVGVFAYSLQIYFDFSAYSDMAIGLGKMFGFTLPENFNFPYISTSVKEFWRRWHMTLSGWFRDYIYIPLGGNKKGAHKRNFNILIVFLLTGIWHGASWLFVLWGIYFGILLVFENHAQKLLILLPKFFRWLLTYILIHLGWVLFRSETLSNAFSYYKILFSPQLPTLSTIQIFVHKIGFESLFFLFLGFILSLQLHHKFFKFFLRLFPQKSFPYLRPFKNPVILLSNILLLLISIGYLATATYNPFIYFRF